MGCVGKSICAGDLKHLVSVQENPRPSDGYGGYDNDSSAWAEKFTIWCKVVEKSGDEKFAHHRVETRARVVFTTRYRNDIEETYRLFFEGKGYNIRRVDDLKRQRRWLEITTDVGVVD